MASGDEMCDTDSASSCSPSPRSSPFLSAAAEAASMPKGKGDVSMEEIDEYNRVVTQTFKREDDCYVFYNAYARSKGFSIRKDRVRKDEGTNEVIWRRYLCSDEGYRDLKHFGKAYKIREPRALTRCGCKAKLEVQLCKKSGTWYVSNFVDKHNHHLLRSEHTFILRSQRGMKDHQKYEAIELGLGGLRTCQIMDVMEKNHGGPDDTGFLVQDLYNFFARQKKERIEGRDADYVLNYMRSKQEEDCEFFFKYDVDEVGRLKNLFWSDSQSQLDYVAFGDVVIFDSTYRVNRYNLPFVPFIGVNHHRSTVVFGCGIISYETVTSYKWLLEALLEAMNQKYPESVITDGDAAMAKSIEQVLATTDHRLCSWHIEQRMILHLRGEKLKDFRKFIYHAMDVDEFERCWLQFVETHGTRQNELWMWRMYELRFKWAATYTKGRKFLGMQSNQQSESLNSRPHNHLDRLMSLVDLVEHYEFCLSRIRRNTVELDGKALAQVPFTEPDDDLFVQQSSRIFTPTIFLKVRAQIQRMSALEVKQVVWDDDDSMRFEVACSGTGARLFHVTCAFNGSTLVNIRCSCRMLECEGIPCSHMFCAMRSLNLDSLPACCVYIRWTMQATSAFPTDRVTNTHVWSEQMDRFRGLRNKGIRALFKASKSVEESQRVMQFLDGIIAEDVVDKQSTEKTSFGPLPALFSSANPPGINRVFNPKKIITKGAPPTNRRLRRFNEKFKKR